VIAAGGKLPLATVLRCRVRYFTAGAVLGSRTFVEIQLARYREKTGRLSHRSPQDLPPATDWGDWTTLRALQGSEFG
jgi:hypothetical protein